MKLSIDEIDRLWKARLALRRRKKFTFVELDDLNRKLLPCFPMMIKEIRRLQQEACSKTGRTPASEE